MNLYLNTPPDEEPITVDEAREQVRLTYVEEDLLLARLITAARQWGEAYTGRRFVAQTWELRLPAFPPVIELPMPPAQTVMAVRYLDSDEVEQTFASDQYRVSGLQADGTRAVIELEDGVSWPTTATVHDAVRVLFIAGYGTAAEVPQGIKNGLLAHVAEAFNNRERPVFSAAEMMLWPWVVTRFD